MKHIFLYVAPLYVIYLLSNYCFVQVNYAYRSWEEYSYWYQNKQFIIRWSRFVTVAFFTLLIFATSFGPFIALGQTRQVLSRLFPFKRGLTHAYWAPNVWSLYSALDVVLSRLMYLGPSSSSSLHESSAIESAASSQLTRGMVGEFTTRVLPKIEPVHCFLLTLLAMCPVLFEVWKRPHPKSFLTALLYAFMCSFMCGYHVHEKAVLMITIPLRCFFFFFCNNRRVITKCDLCWFIACCCVVVCYNSKVALHWTLWIMRNSPFLLPLLPNMQETPIKLLLVLLHGVLMYVLLDNEIRYYQSKHRYAETGLNLHFFEWLYLFGFAGVQLFYSVIQPLLFPRWEFLPLMFFSVYSAFGCCYAWRKCYRLFQETQRVIFMTDD
ncbi:putative dolichyl pyrophosphate Glc1Man9GlcNAc2 alpha-1,3-glucosyltransferase [Reticulomyxa filosa]|uniref:Alpha-1,3-glucosyltransferase n=1 Tax=Reticulomyxa filosa TaxID=46433 RepID=X6LWI3_RETFI|nr:putative dolichyl pyrophosphate Glc1Man9GlcNAc2 alpha-1,3-glucosyltransferase [Reticulomyxa filosa]|eukprot:ETO05969.1 putative dolichyl pyrophosphate Glc1Man9GlcNAc2 alpha-1,3-glucosyltransferase [Reticulomyxa filosa]